MNDKSTKQKVLVALILWMIISQVLGIITILFYVLIFGAELEDRGLVDVICFINPVWVVGLSITSWISFTHKRYKRSLIATSITFIPATLYFLFMVWANSSAK